MLRIACFGYVKKDSGSVSGANFLVLEELLNRGHQIDFFGWKGFNEPRELRDRKNFEFIALPDKAFVRKSIKRFLPSPMHSLFDRTIGGLIQNLYSEQRSRRILRDTVAEEHSKQEYDVLLFLGLYATFRVKDLPVVSWAQGTPHTEWHYLQKLKPQIIQLCGPLPYLQFLLFYTLKSSRLKGELSNTDIFICGSEWSREQMIDYGIEPNSINVLPYPMDLDFFKPISSEKFGPTHKKTFLWLGRIDPRKRLDLLMSAYALLIKERQDVHLKIIGSLRHTKGYKELIDRFDFPNYVEYQSSINRQEIPDLIRACDVLIQPSEGENFGSSVAEAMACGVPSILGPTNGTQEFTSAGCTFIFDEYTPESIQKTMLEALEKLDHSAAAIAAEARQTAEKNFSIAQVINGLEQILRNSIASSSKSSKFSSLVMDKVS